MAAEVSVSAASIGAHLPLTITGTGFDADTDLVVEVTGAMGWTRFIEVTSDGSGEFTCEFVPQTDGDATIEVRPAQHTVLASASFKSV